MNPPCPAHTLLSVLFRLSMANPPWRPCKFELAGCTRRGHWNMIMEPLHGIGGRLMRTENLIVYLVLLCWLEKCWTVLGRMPSNTLKLLFITSISKVSRLFSAGIDKRLLKTGKQKQSWKLRVGPCNTVLPTCFYQEGRHHHHRENPRTVISQASLSF